MTDIENRDIIRAILELLKAQVKYMGKLHESFSILQDALERDHPQLSKNLSAEVEKIRLNPEISEQLVLIDALLEKLGKAQGQ
jgi:hypothetical protein